MTDSGDVATALLGSWPQQVASWGKSGIAAYLAELEARDVSPAAALAAIRSCGPEQKFPPSAPELAGLARVDSSAPTFVEMMRLVYGRGGILRARPGSLVFPDVVARDRAFADAARARCAEVHPLVGSFALRYGIERLRGLEIEHPDYGEVRRKDLERAWDQHCEAMQGRELAAIGQGRRGEGLARLDPLSGLGLRPVPVAEIEAGES